MDQNLLSIKPRSLYTRAMQHARRLLRPDVPTTGRRINIGLIGAGNVFHWLYHRSLRNPRSPFRLKAVFDVNPLAARTVTDEFNAVCCASIEDIVCRDDIEAVLICTPTSVHGECVLAALKHGKHILCEKPLGTSAAECRRIWAASRQADTVSMLNFIFRIRPEFMLIQRLIATGVLGRIHHLWGCISQGRWYAEDGSPCFDRSDAAAWKFDRQNGGVLSDLGPHVIDLARWLLGEIHRVQAWVKDSCGAQEGASAACGMTLEFQNNAVAQLLTSRLSTGFKERTALDLSGSDGAVRLDDRGLHLWTRDTDRWRTLLVPPPGPDMLTRFHGAITGSSAHWATFLDGLMNSEALEAVTISARHGTSEIVAQRPPLPTGREGIHSLVLAATLDS